jgi:hypothetical protein
MLYVVPAPPPINCDAGKLLDRARIALDREFYIEAGALMREAMRQAILCLCEYHELPLPRRKLRRTTGGLALLLHHVGALTDQEIRLVLQVIEIGNRAVHCAFVERTALSSAIAHTSRFVAEMPRAAGGEA